MEVDIIPIGNSRGIRIPKVLLEQCGFDRIAEIEVKDNRLVITPIPHARSGWNDAFKAMAARGDDQLMDGATANAFDDHEWKW